MTTLDPVSFVIREAAQGIADILERIVPAKRPPVSHTVTDDPDNDITLLVISIPLPTADVRQQMRKLGITPTT